MTLARGLSEVAADAAGEEFSLSVHIDLYMQAGPGSDLISYLSYRSMFFFPMYAEKLKEFQRFQ